MQQNKLSNMENTNYNNITIPTQLFRNNERSYMCEQVLYSTYFKKIPNIIIETRIDCVKANAWFKTEYANCIKEHFYTKFYISKLSKVEFDDLFYLIDDDLMVNFDTNNEKVRILFKNTSEKIIQNLVHEFLKFKVKKQKDKPEISVLVSSMGGDLFRRSLAITKSKLCIEDNYNDDFLPIHQIIKNRLSKNNDKGLILLHGKPGTGKTSYLRFLITTLKKEVIFLPPNMANALTGPNLVETLIGNPNTILVIEDAENILMDRERTGSSAVSALLNISDGLLSDCLNIQIICSFNTDIAKVDSALLRKGRLIAKYEFKALEIEKAQALSNKLNFTKTITEPTILTDIYNQDEQSFDTPKKYANIGFMANGN